MKIKAIILCSVVLLLTGCATEFNRVFKSTDYDYRYEYAKQCFAEGRFGRAEQLLQDLITLKKGTDEAEEALYMLAMSQYMNGDYETAAATFKKYYSLFNESQITEKMLDYINYEKVAFSTAFNDTYTRYGLPNASGSTLMQTRQYNTHEEAVSYLTDWLTRRKTYLDTTWLE